MLLRAFYSRVCLHKRNRMKTRTWVFSGLLTLGGLPILVVLEAIRFGGAHVGKIELDFVWYSMVAIPLVWVAAFVLCRVEAQRRQRRQLMWVYRLLPYGAWAGHILIVAFTLQWASGAHRRANERALASIEAAFKLAPNQAENFVARGDLMTNTASYDRAVADFAEAIRLKPAYAAAYYGRGFAYTLKDERDRAFADYTEAVRLDPNHIEAHRQRGFHFRNLGQWDEAIAEFEAVRRVAPDDANAKKQLASLREQKAR